MAFGAPVVASDTPGYRAVITPGYGGLLVPPEDPVRPAGHLPEAPRRCCWGLIPRTRLKAVLRAKGLP
jgi:glycosyltransferase involved in cell wall biosynthesis